MSNKVKVEQEISKKWKQLKDNKRSLGEPLGLVQNAGHGGWFRRYKKGHIYWHPVMGDTGAHEVHGNILKRYLQLGGPGVNTETGKRELGFPTTDETRTADGLYPVSCFEWGAIYAVRGAGDLSIHGDIYKEWKRSGVELGKLGYPITDHIMVAEGEAVYFQRGCLWKGHASDNAVVMSSFCPPLIGKPDLIDPQSTATFRLTVSFYLKKEVRDTIKQRYPTLFAKLWRDRLILQQVVAKKKPTAEIPLTPRKTPGEGIQGGMVSIRVNLRPSSSLQDRALYSLGFRLPNGRTYVVAPHAFYARKSWKDFGFIHATDLHVSKRVDRFKAALRKAGVKQSNIAEVNNFNDRFRDLIRHANKLHDQGKLDFVLATGDLVDYLYEWGDNRKSGGNFAFLEDLVLGKAPSPDGVENRELRVPMFTCLGNHDYRSNPYPLLFNVLMGADDFLSDIPILGDVYETAKDLASRIPGISLVGQIVDRWTTFNAATIRNFKSHNLTEREAIILGGFVDPVTKKRYVPGLEGEKAAKVAAVNLGMRNRSSYYFRHVNGSPSYTIKLGKHRIVMIDSQYDAGIIDSSWQAVAAEFGWGSEDEKAFADASPNSIGFTAADIHLVKRALKEASADGLVMIGIHAPPMNTAGNEYAHYFRQTEASARSKEEVEGFLRRHKPGEFFKWDGSQYVPVHDTSKVLPDWMRAKKSYFKRGGIVDLLDYGISKGKTLEFLKLCAGFDQDGEQLARGVDVVFCGHTHGHVEYRLGWDPKKKRLLYFTDFFTENPEAYYASQKVGYEDRVRIEIKEDADLKAKPVHKQDSSSYWKEWWVLTVPPYPKPLNSTGNVKAWWVRKRPLVIQTSSLGPIDKNQRRDRATSERLPDPPFQGVRFCRVENDVLTQIKHVPAAAFRQPHSVVPLDDEVVPPTP